MRPGKLGVFGGAVNLKHAERADRQHEAEKDPIEIAIGNVAGHRFSSPPQDTSAKLGGTPGKTPKDSTVTYWQGLVGHAGLAGGLFWRSIQVIPPPTIP